MPWRWSSSSDCGKTQATVNKKATAAETAFHRRIFKSCQPRSDSWQKRRALSDGDTAWLSYDLILCQGFCGTRG